MQVLVHRAAIEPLKPPKPHFHSMSPEALMMRYYLDVLFAIEPGHRLVEDPPLAQRGDIPYRSFYFSELDTTGQPVFRYRLWFAFDGHVFGAEKLDPEGNVLDRRVDSDRHPKTAQLETIA